MKYVKIFILLITFIIFVNPIFACAISGIVNGITCNSCDNTTKICECNVNTTPLESSTSKLFSLSGCEDYTVNLNLNAKTIWFKENLNMNDTNWNLVISGSSNIVIDNSKSLDINLSNIIVMENAKLNISTLDTSQRNDVSLVFKSRDIEVKPQAELKIKLKTNDGTNGGGPSSNNWLSIDDGSNWDGKPGTESGNLNFSYINLLNYGKIDINLETGKGGDGGTTNEGDSSGNALQDGGHGAISGDLNFDTNNTKNFGQLNINLKTGNGGNGGHSAKDDGADEGFKGGNGKNAGSINILIKTIENSGPFLFSAIGGNGGLGGTKRHASDNSTCEEGQNGNSGDGGSILDINISTLINESLEFKIYIENGMLGRVNLVDGSCGQKNGAAFGHPGDLGNINISFLENTNSAIDIISKFNFTQEDYTLSLNSQNNSSDDLVSNGGHMIGLNDLGITVTNVNINNLKNGSYLPKSINIKSEPEHPIFNNSIDLSGCYIQPSQVTYNLNGGTNIYATNIESINSFLPAGTSVNYRYCPHCEVIDLTDEVNRYTREYNIYSNVNGKILPGDLKIFYFNPVTNQIYYTKRIDNTLQPIYTNKEEISSEMNDKIGMREFKLEKNKLVWFGSSQDEDRNDLAEDEYLFCYGQEYILKGKITIGNNSKEFEFPFVPLRELFNN